MLHQHFLGDFLQPDAADPGVRAGEILVDQFAAQANRLEGLRAVVTAQRRDAQLGEDFEQSFVDGLDVAVFGLDVIAMAGKSPFLEQIVDGGKRAVGIDRAGAIAEEQRKMHDFAGFRRFDDQARLRFAS